jgi:photosystem II stability/assembly factor-like uncharacterized protein
MALNMRISDLSAHNLLRTKALVHVVILLCATLPTIHAQTDVSSLPTAGGAATSIHVSHVIPSSTPPWRELQLPVVDTTLSGIQFIDALHGWVWGRSGNVLRTTNGGITWSVSQVDTICSLERVRFVNAINGWALGFAPFGDSVMLYFSPNGGASWEQKYFPPGLAANLALHINASVFFDDSTALFIKTHFTLNNLWITQDRGLSWDSIPSDLAVDPSLVAFADRDIGFAANQFTPPCLSEISKSYNQGRNWTFPPRAYWDTLFEGHIGEVLDLSSPHAGRVFVGGLVRTNCEPPPIPFVQAAAAVSFTSGNDWLRFYCCGGFGQPSDEFTKGDALDTNHIWLLKRSGVLLRTTNGGNVWVGDTLAVPIKDFSWLGQNTAWAVGGNGRVYLYDSTLVSVAQLKELLPSVLSLHQNYPNPFNAQTVLEYNIGVPGKVEIILIDLLGRLVMEHRQYHEVPGRHGYRIDVSDKSSGVYVAIVRFLSKSSGHVEKRIKILLLR